MTMTWLELGDAERARRRVLEYGKRAGLSPKAWAAFAGLAGRLDEGLATWQVHRAFGWGRNSRAAVIRRLRRWESLGLIEQGEDPEDPRGYAWEITERGALLVAKYLMTKGQR